MFEVESPIIVLLQREYPESVVTVGPGVIDLDKKQVIAVHSSGVPIDSKARGGKWVVDVTVFDTDRDSSITTCGRIVKRLLSAADEGLLGGAVGGQVLQLPTFVENKTSSMAHAVSAAALQFVGRFG